MKELQYKIGDTLYFVQKTKIVKAFVEETIQHNTKKGLIVKYIVRPFGIDQTITIDVSQIKPSLKVAKKDVKNYISKVYNKTNIKKAYNDAIKIAEEKYKKEMDNFSEHYQKMMKVVDAIDEEIFEEYESELQDQLQAAEKEGGKE